MMKKTSCSRIDDYRKLLRILFMTGTSLELLAISSFEIFPDKKTEKETVQRSPVPSSSCRQYFTTRRILLILKLLCYRNVCTGNNRTKQIQNNTWNAKCLTTKNAAKTIKTCTVNGWEGDKKTSERESGFVKRKKRFDGISGISSWHTVMYRIIRNFIIMSTVKSLECFSQV